MNDYLWDKKGEPDAEVARLEALLGAFAHEPRPLELPADAVAPEPTPAKLLPFAPRLRASRLFAPAALAAAAALVVASVLVASAFLRARVANESERSAAPESSRPKNDARKEEGMTPREPERVMLEPPDGGLLKDKKKVETLAVVNLSNVARQRKAAQTAVVLKRTQKGLAAEPSAGGTGERGRFALEAMNTRAVTSSLVENTRLLTKEQLVYALRFTGAKLKDVREKAQGAENSRQ